jgi:hypothetical protein
MEHIESFPVNKAFLKAGSAFGLLEAPPCLKL